MNSTVREVVGIAWPTLVIVLSIVIILKVTYILKSERRKIHYHEEIFQLLFMAYLIVLFQLVTSQDLSGGGTNFIPFREIMRYEFGSPAFYRQVFGNIMLFIPLGYFASCFCKIKNLGTISIVSLLSSLTIEVVQHYIGRSFDIDDILLNVTGGVVGFLLYTALSAIKKHLPKALQKDWIYDVLSIVILVLFGLYLYRVIV